MLQAHHHKGAQPSSTLTLNHTKLKLEHCSTPSVHPTASPNQRPDAACGYNWLATASSCDPVQHADHHSHVRCPPTACLLAMLVGPPRLGIQKKPLVSSPSSAAFVNARYKPMKTGMVARVGRHPAKGLMPAGQKRRQQQSHAEVPLLYNSRIGQVAAQTTLVMQLATPYGDTRTVPQPVLLPSALIT